MPTIVLQLNQTGGRGSALANTRDNTATVSVSPGRYHYATVNGIPRTFERVGTDRSGNEIYREQTRRRR